jgi:glycerol-3-phosphate acyltransferase PlsY
VVLGAPHLTLLTILLAALVFERHRANIARIRRGEEPKIGGKKDT